MKTCPQCQTAYEEDYIYCLMDGKPLYDNDRETETETAYRTPIVIPTSAQPDNEHVFCDSCGTENRSTSRFCKKCGALLSAADAGHVQPVVIAPQPVRANNSSLYAAIAVIAILVALATLIGGYAYISRIDTNRAAVTTSPAPAVNAVNKPSVSPTPANREVNKPVNSNANTVAPANTAPEVGRTGHLTTNQRIRVASNRYSEIVGVHYMNARVEVLEVETYPTEDGDSTWYRVRILKDGCDAEGVRGCGNDLNGVSGQAARVGWMNARYIELD